MSRELDILKVYIQEVRNYDLLTPEEEVRLGKNLLIRDKIKIFKDQKDGKSIDLRKVFASISNEKDKETILNKLTDMYYDNSSIGLSKNTKILDKLNEYKKLCNEIGGFPNKTILQEYFNEDYQDVISLSSEELNEQIDLYCTFLDAKIKFVNANLRLVIEIAYKNRFRNLESSTILDLISQGNMGLLSAIERFDVNLGYKFSTYASRWISCYISRGCVNEDAMIRLPSYVHYDANKYKETKRNVMEDMGRTISDVELAQVTNYDMKEIKNYETLPEVISYNTKISDSNSNDKETELFEVLSGTGDEFIDEIDNKIRKKKIKAILSEVLKPRELFILTHRFGLNGNEPETLEEVSRYVNITRERVRQIEKTAKKKIKKYDENNGAILRKYLSDFN